MGKGEVRGPQRESHWCHGAVVVVPDLPENGHLAEENGVDQLWKNTRNSISAIDSIALERVRERDMFPNIQSTGKTSLEKRGLGWV